MGMFEFDASTEAAATAALGIDREPISESPSTLPGADLTESQRSFALAWLKCQNKTQAYLLAYPNTKSQNTAKTEGARLSRDPRILRFIEAVRQQVIDLSAVSVSQIEEQAARFAFLDLRKAFDDSGQLRDPHDWPDDIGLAAQGYKESEGKYGVSKSLKFPDKNAALRLLAELKGALRAPGAGDGKAEFHFHLGGQKAANAAAKGRQLPKAGSEESGTYDATTGAKVLEPLEEMGAER